MAGITAMLMAGVAAHAELNIQAEEHSVPVCMKRTDPRVSPGVLLFAEALASRIFASIGVTIEWRTDLQQCPAEGIRINLSFRTPEELKPGALAYAKPYEGAHVLVLYDRIAQNPCQRQIPYVLGHVLAHEITHMLQGISRHSASGVMKANWTRNDFAGMVVQPLRFEDKDVELIYEGLARRAASLKAESRVKRETAVAGLRQRK
jgi:hypothetical protein